VAKGKFRGSARNSAACRKLWALLIDIPECELIRRADIEVHQGESPV